MKKSIISQYIQALLLSSAMISAMQALASPFTSPCYKLSAPGTSAANSMETLCQKNDPASGETLFTLDSPAQGFHQTYHTKAGLAADCGPNCVYATFDPVPGKGLSVSISGQIRCHTEGVTASTGTIRIGTQNYSYFLSWPDTSCKATALPADDSRPGTPVGPEVNSPTGTAAGPLN